MYFYHATCKTEVVVVVLFFVFPLDKIEFYAMIINNFTTLSRVVEGPAL